MWLYNILPGSLSFKELSQEQVFWKDELVASFTESPGDSVNKTAKNLKNLRIEYPLYSGFPHHQGKNIEILANG